MGHSHPPLLPTVGNPCRDSIHADGAADGAADGTRQPRSRSNYPRRRVLRLAIVVVSALGSRRRPVTRITGRMVCTLGPDPGRKRELIERWNQRAAVDFSRSGLEFVTPTSCTPANFPDRLEQERASQPVGSPDFRRRGPTSGARHGAPGSGDAGVARGLQHALRAYENTAAVADPVRSPGKTGAGAPWALAAERGGARTRTCRSESAARGSDRSFESTGSGRQGPGVRRSRRTRLGTRGSSVARRGSSATRGRIRRRGSRTAGVLPGAGQPRSVSPRSLGAFARRIAASSAMISRRSSRLRA